MGILDFIFKKAEPAIVSECEVCARSALGHNHKVYLGRYLESREARSLCNKCEVVTCTTNYGTFRGSTYVEIIDSVESFVCNDCFKEEMKATKKLKEDVGRHLTIALKKELIPDYLDARLYSKEYKRCKRVDRSFWTGAF